MTKLLFASELLLASLRSRPRFCNRFSSTCNNVVQNVIYGVAFFFAKCTIFMNVAWWMMIIGILLIICGSKSGKKLCNVQFVYKNACTYKSLHFSRARTNLNIFMTFSNTQFQLKIQQKHSFSNFQVMNYILRHFCWCNWVQ